MDEDFKDPFPLLEQMHVSSVEMELQTARQAAFIAYGALQALGAKDVCKVLYGMLWPHSELPADMKEER